MSTFICRMDESGSGPRLAVKDLIDVAGVPTTAGSRAVEKTAQPADKDAPCLAGARAAGARIVGKANLHELAMLPVGTNPWFGTPVNPLDPALIPGGSSSGSAVAVATDEADVAFGSDTGGSVRIPSACCGTSGLKTTHGRVSLDGVWPLAPSLDTVGPMAVSVAGLVTGMQLLEPGFVPAASSAKRIGRLRTTSDPRIDQAVDEALRTSEVEVVDLDWDGFEDGNNIFAALFFNEVWAIDHELAEKNPDDVGADIKQTLSLIDVYGPGYADAKKQLAGWRDTFLALFERVELVALPTLPVFPPRLDSLNDETFLPTVIDITRHVSLWNPIGVPCTAQPVPVAGYHLPASLQLIGPANSEELLLTTAARVESASGTLTG